MTVVSQLVAGSLAGAELAPQVLAKMEPWLEFARETIERALAGTPLAGLVPVDEAASAVITFYLGVNLLSNLDGGTHTDALFAHLRLARAACSAARRWYIETVPLLLLLFVLIFGLFGAGSGSSSSSRRGRPSRSGRSRSPTPGAPSPCAAASKRRSGFRAAGSGRCRTEPATRSSCRTSRRTGTPASRSGGSDAARRGTWTVPDDRAARLGAALQRQDPRPLTARAPLLQSAAGAPCATSFR